MLCSLVVIQRLATRKKTSSINHSDHFIGPMAFNSTEASSLAAGVCFTSGGKTRYRTHETRRRLTRPGTIAPRAQRAYVMSMPDDSFEKRAMIGFDACPVRNIAQTITLH